MGHSLRTRIIGHNKRGFYLKTAGNRSDDNISNGETASASISGNGFGTGISCKAAFPIVMYQ